MSEEQLQDSNKPETYEGDSPQKKEELVNYLKDSQQTNLGEDQKSTPINPLPDTVKEQSEHSQSSHKNTQKPLNLMDSGQNDEENAENTQQPLLNLNQNDSANIDNEPIDQNEANEQNDQNEANENNEQIEANEVGEFNIEKKTTKTFQESLKDLRLLYKYKKRLLKNNADIQNSIENFWKLLKHDFEGECPKEEILRLLSKIFKVLLPIFNYSQIDQFIEGLYLKFAKGKNTLSREEFSNVIFFIAHVFCTHIHKSEYEEFLQILYKRLTKVKKTYQNQEEKTFLPTIKVHLINPISREEYNLDTYEVFQNVNSIHYKLYEPLEYDEEMGAGKVQEFNEEKKEGEEKKEEIQEEVHKTTNEKMTEGNELRARPKLYRDEETSYYNLDTLNFYLYDEETFFLDQEEIDKKEMNSSIKYELLEDDELVIFGYPTQYVLNRFINNKKELDDLINNNNNNEPKKEEEKKEEEKKEEEKKEVDIKEEEKKENAENPPSKTIESPKESPRVVESPANDYDCILQITDYQPYEKQKIYLKIKDKEKLSTFLFAPENSKFILVRDLFRINPTLSLGKDYDEEELNVINNLRRNFIFDRYVDIHEINLPDGGKLKVNMDNLILNPTYRKAFNNILNEKTKSIGIKSQLWDETIEQKIETVIRTKFEIAYIKLLRLNFDYTVFEDYIDLIIDEMSKETYPKLLAIEENFKFFDKFMSKEGTKNENFEHENDLFDEVNKKAPIVFIIGPPRIGKTEVSKKLADDLSMVYLDPMKFFDEINKKVADFEEKMLTWDEEHPKEEEAPPEEDQNEEEDQKKKKKVIKKEEPSYLASWEPEPPKVVKPELDSVLNPVELDVYRDLEKGAGISELNMQRMYQYILHSDLAKSRGVVIDMNSHIPPSRPEDFNNDTRSFTEKVIDGYYGECEIDYVIDLTMDINELRERNKDIKFNLKTNERISKRQIELMKKPKVPKKEILEDEIEYDEEGKPVVPEAEPEPELGDEELEKIPKPKDLINIMESDKIFDDELSYYERTQYPKAMEYVQKLKTNYYIKVDVTGLDFEEVSNLIKCRLDFANPLRPIAKALEPGDFKGLLQDGREGALPYRKWSPWKQIDPVALKDEYLILTGSTEFPAVYFGRVFLFVKDENRKKFLDNPKKYISSPPQVPANYRVSIIGPPKSGKSMIAEMLKNLYGWRICDMDEIYEGIKEYQKTWENPELNSVYTLKVHFSEAEFKEVLANAAKKPSDRKPDNFTSKIVFTLDSLGIPLDKKRTKEQFFAFRKYHRNKLQHLFNRMKEAVERQKFEENEDALRKQEEEAEKKRLEDEAKEEVELFQKMSECARSLYEVEKDKRAENYQLHVQEKQKEKEQRQIDLEEKEKRNPYPPEEEYNIEDLRSDQFFLAFDEEGNQPRVNGIILMNHPFNEDECVKLKDFNIDMDRIIFLKDDTDEGIKALTERRLPNFNNLKEEKQAEEIEKTKADLGKYDEAIAVLKEKYNINNEESVIEVGYNEPIDQLKLKLVNFLNPFNVKIDQEDKVIQPGDVNQEEKYPLSRGPFGLFCPVVYKEDNWLFYSPEANEVQVNQKVYRCAGEKEVEKFKNNPALYLGEQGSLMPIDVPPPHIMITGYQGSGITFYSNVLGKQFRLKKRELQTEFMQVWEKQRLERKQVRINKKREELMKQNEEIEQKNIDLKKENPEAEPEPLLNIDDVIKEDAALDEEGEDYNATENDMKIFKSIFNPLTPTIYDASWNGMEEKVQTPFVDLLNESRRVPNVMIVLKVTLKSIMDRLFHIEEIEHKYDKLLKESNDKRKQRETELIKQKRQEKFDELKAQYEEEMQNQEQEQKEENKEEGENPDEKPVKKEPKKPPVLEEIVIELTDEEKDDIWKSADPDLVEKETLIQTEKERLTQRYEANVSAIQTLVDTLKERGVPVVEINNDSSRENVYTNILYELTPYLKNRKNLIEKQLVYNKEFTPPISLRKLRELYYNSEVYLPSVYNKLSPVNPSKFCIRTDYPIVYRDRVYLFNTPEEKKVFEEFPLDYRTGRECPKDCYPMKGRTIINVIGKYRAGKSTIAKLLSKYMGYKRVTVKSAILDLTKLLKPCQLLEDINDILYNGKVSNDDLITKIINRRITLEDLVNENVVIDGFPYSPIQACELPETLYPDLIFVAECDKKEMLKRAFRQKNIKKIPEIIEKRTNNIENSLGDIINIFNQANRDIRYFDMTKSKWYIKEQIQKFLENRKKAEMSFARNLSKDIPCVLTDFVPKKLLKSIKEYNSTHNPLMLYSPVALKNNYQFKYNKHLDNIFHNFIIYTPRKFEDVENELYYEEKTSEVQIETNPTNRKHTIPTVHEEEKKQEEIKIEERKEEDKKQEEEVQKEIVEAPKVEEASNQILSKEEVLNLEEKEHLNQIEKENSFTRKMTQRISVGELPLKTNREANFSRDPTVKNTIKSYSKSSIKEPKLEPFVPKFHFLTNEEEVEQFTKNTQNYKNFIKLITFDAKPPKSLSMEKIAEIIYEDEKEYEKTVENDQENNENEENEEEDRLEMKMKLGMNVGFEYQNCCPVTIKEDRIMKEGKLVYTSNYLGKYYKFLSLEKMIKFNQNPHNYINQQLPVRKVIEEENDLKQKQIMFNNTVNFLEFTFGSLITKGMHELSNNRIKYPYLNVRETSLKYLALFLKANNPNNNAFAKKKYSKILKDFIRNSKLPLELYRVYEEHQNEKEDMLHKKLIRKQLDHVSQKYDDLLDKAKIQYNTRFKNFFKINASDDN